MTSRQIMATTFEHLSVELFYEIFIYFQFHEIFNIFSNLNSRFAAIIDNTSVMPVYLGFNGMSIEVTITSIIHIYHTQTSSIVLFHYVSQIH